LKDHALTGLDISIMGYNEAIRVSMERLIRGKATISVTGNVLREYLTDLFPTTELGPPAKILSLAPLMAGRGMDATGDGGP
ncbi:NADP-dependent isocitrate dehydrogenase, partial [Pseudomonas aeruginosa]|uniref:NADP-dependent isocitrate dehydrogenase n=1 Tax=Pseudomonas aeruginosa TaxID=287 RepID=UPI0024AEC7C0